MTTGDVWPAVEQLATIWAASDLVQYFLGSHPAHSGGDNHVSETLSDMHAGTWLLTEAPLLTTMWEPLAAQMPSVQLTDETRKYLRTIVPLGQVLECTVAWVRSRLPMYPKILAPQFASRGFRRTEEAGLRLSWRQQCLAAGLQSEPAPPAVAAILKVGEADIEQASQRVLNALASSDEWLHYASLTEALTESDVNVLAAARNRVNVLLSPAKVNDYEPSKLARRHDYRRKQVRIVVNDLEGLPRDLAEAFETVDDLIDHALVNVHGQLIISGTPATIDPQDLELDGRELKFRYSGGDAPTAGDIVRLSDPLVPEVILLQSTGFQFGQPDFNGFTYRGQRLPASQEAFLGL